MTDSFITSLTRCIKEADEAITHSNSLLDQFTEQTKEVVLDDFEKLRSIQLVLQYRLDTQSALRKLGSLQQYYLQLLGIESLHSREFNLERLNYAMGSDELQHILAMLNQLVDSLLHVLALQLKQQTLDKKKALERVKNLKHLNVLSKSIDFQKTFVAKIDEMKLVLEDIAGAPHPGVIYDHIAAMEGPISRFHQAIEHGLVAAAGLYQQMHLQAHLENHLAETLQKVDQALHQLSYHPEPQRLFTAPLQNVDKDKLELRAHEKRFSNFYPNR